MTVKEKRFSSRWTIILLQRDEAVRRERPKAELLMGNDEVMHLLDTQNMHYLPLFHRKYGHANPPQCYAIPAFSVLFSATYIQDARFVLWRNPFTYTWRLQIVRRIGGLVVFSGLHIRNTFLLQNKLSILGGVSPRKG